MAKAAAHTPKVHPVRPEAKAATFREVFADSEFRAIWLAELASIAGEQFARVALTVLVYQRTGSPLLTALTYAASYLPWLIGGLILSDAADRYPRRDVMITGPATPAGPRAGRCPAQRRRGADASSRPPPRAPWL